MYPLSDCTIDLNQSESIGTLEKIMVVKRIDRKMIVNKTKVVTFIIIPFR